MGASGSSPVRGEASFRSSKHTVLERWRKRPHPSQLFGVIRHLERADGVYAFYKTGRWTQTDDFRRWPVDPPLSDAGLEAGLELGAQVREHAAASGSSIHVLVTSPYLRCIQTAAVISRELGPLTRVIIDRALGEVFGSSIMGETMPTIPIRSIEETNAYFRSIGARLPKQRMIGEWPVWGEDLLIARRRYAARFLTYLNRSKVTRRNFVLVTHADCVGAALSMMPSHVDQLIQSVEYGGLFFARRAVKISEVNSPHQEHARSSIVSALGPAPVVPSVSMGKPSTWMRGRRRSCPNSFSTVVPAMETGDESPEEGWSGRGIESHVDGGLSDSGEEDSPDSHAIFGLSQSDPVQPSHDSWMGGSPDSQTSSSRMTEAMVAPDKDWQVHTHNVIIRQKPGKTSSSRVTAALSKRVKLLTRDSRFSPEQIEQLLGSMSGTSLGKGDEESRVLSRLSVTSSTGAPPHSITTTSFSTYMFGCSEGGSINGDLEGSFGPNSRIHTQGSIIDEHATLPVKCFDSDVIGPGDGPARSHGRANTTGEDLNSQRRHSGQRHSSQLKSQGLPLSPRNSLSVPDASLIAGRPRDKCEPPGSTDDELSPLPVLPGGRSRSSSRTGGTNLTVEPVQKSNLRHSSHSNGEPRRRSMGTTLTPPNAAHAGEVSTRHSADSSGAVVACSLRAPISATEFLISTATSENSDVPLKTQGDVEPNAEPDAFLGAVRKPANDNGEPRTEQECKALESRSNTAQVIIQTVEGVGKAPPGPLKSLASSALLKRRRNFEGATATPGENA